MAKLTNAQLIAQLEELRTYCDRVETERDALRAEVERLSAPRQPAAWRVTSDRRRALSRQYFAAYPNATSVTDAQLAQFSQGV